MAQRHARWKNGAARMNLLELQARMVTILREHPVFGDGFIGQLLGTVRRTRERSLPVLVAHDFVADGFSQGVLLLLGQVRRLLERLLQFLGHRILLSSWLYAIPNPASLGKMSAGCGYRLSSPARGSGRSTL